MASSSAARLLMSARATSSAWPTCLASSAAGVAANVGGLSNTMILFGAPRVSLLRTDQVRSLARYSLSRPVRWPAGNTQSPGISVPTTKSSM